MSKVKGYYKIIRLYNNKETKTIRENITEKVARSHCKSKNGKGTEWKDYYTSIRVINDVR